MPDFEKLIADALKNGQVDNPIPGDELSGNALRDIVLALSSSIDAACTNAHASGLQDKIILEFLAAYLGAHIANIANFNIDQMTEIFARITKLIIDNMTVNLLANGGRL